MRSFLVGTVTLAGLVVLTARCGGATSSIGNSGDASVDGNGGSGSGSSSGSSGSGGSSGGGSGGGSGGSSGGSGGSSGGSCGGGSGGSSGGGSDAGMCTKVCTLGQICCGDACVDKYDDPFNCGACGHVCPDAKPTCEQGNCVVPPCDSMGNTCGNGETCCGTSCCTQGQLCCVIEGPVQQLPRCITPTSQQPTCPVGCPVCP